VSWFTLCFKMANIHVAARVITDRDTGKSRGFGFVNYTSSDAANAAISGMDGKVSRTCPSYCLFQVGKYRPCMLCFK